MSEEYLWDRSGERDPEVERLEALLRPLAHSPVRSQAQSQVKSPVRRVRRPNAWWPYAIAAALLLAVGGWWRWSASGPALGPASESWQTSLGRRLPVGEWLDAAAEVEVQVAEIGQVTVAKGSRLRIESARAGDYRLRLERGHLDALILAPPRQFAVSTPAALAVDLGCAYSLDVGADGVSTVSVSSGWVAFEQNGAEAFIPAGAVCRASPRFGLGVPYFSDAPAELRAAVERFEETRELALPRVTRARDGVTLWHLLPRVAGQTRELVYRQLAATITVPAGVTRAQILAGDRRALETLWGELGLGDAAFWRAWQRPLPK